jgi:hypothetical protein
MGGEFAGALIAGARDFATGSTSGADRIPVLDGVAACCATRATSLAAAAALGPASCGAIPMSFTSGPRRTRLNALQGLAGVVTNNSRTTTTLQRR